MNTSYRTQIVTLTLGLLVAAIALAFDHPPGPVQGNYTITFNKGAKLGGLSQVKLLNAISNSHPLTGTRVRWDGLQIWPPLRNVAMQTPTAGSKPTPSPVLDTIHVTQSIGFASETDLETFIKLLK